MDTNLIERIEAQRLELEANIAKLRNNLHLWTTLELDYEGLKDEFQTLREGATKSDCFKAAHDFAPQRVDEKELNDLIEPVSGRTRSPFQIVELLSKRIDYVLRNAGSLRKQISDLEKKRNAVLLAAHPEHEADAVLPLAEITEELDEDGNVLSSKVQQQGDSAKKILDVLQKTKVQPEEGRSPHENLSNPSRPRIEEFDSSEDDSDKSTKAHTVTHDEATGPASTSTGVDQHTFRAAEAYPINPDDNEEEAQMRQEMIHYGIGEVGNIVAELELADAQDGALDDEDDEMTDDLEPDADEDVDDYDDSDEPMDDESEDETGRSKVNLHTDTYRDRMEELQKQLGFKMQNVGPTSKTVPDPTVEEQIKYMRDPEFEEQMEHLPPEFRKRFGRRSAAQAAREAAIAREEASRNATRDTDIKENKPAKDTKRKKVAFASTVDVAPESSRAQPAIANDTITENLSTNVPSTGPAPPIKVSRFKAARASQPQTPLYPPPMDFPSTKQDDRSGPVGKTIAQDLVERPGTSSAEDAPAPDGDDFDGELQRRQIALEHHRLRNRMVHEQGGYVKGGEAENWGDAYAAPEIKDEKTGQPVKVSRFKAARLRP